MSGWVELGTVAFGAITAIATIVKLWMTGTKSAAAKEARSKDRQLREAIKARDECSQALMQARFDLSVWKERRP
jgi:hypothetical protein